ncbi:endopeptidase La [Thalassolituus alkanivorans]|uniref:endopeptidase La n=1 Tax=Thalassolituus alkanivorans TaxID=2881055 RepID=UPI001E3DDD97|nr:endopeptidase La [Thalassolituus alkanivorans]MCB2385899.1 endopeptidase La [Thalassolituus alkanivorans]MCB2421749.1 endopeptidase La [Thalassolituus alkanivorans]
MSDENHEFISREEGAGALALADDVLPETLYILPVNGRPFFPSQVQPVIVDEKVWGETLKRVANSQHKLLGLSFVDDKAADEVPAPERIPDIGCVVRIHRIQAEDGRIQFIAQGIRRFRIREWLSTDLPMQARVQYPQRSTDFTDEIKAYAMAIINAIKELVAINPLYSEELKNYLNHFSPNDPSPLTDFAAAITTAEGKALQDVLATLPLQKRMEKTLVLLKKEVEVARLQAEINKTVNEDISKHQRDFFLKQQLKTIQKELGLAKDDKTAEIDEFVQRLEGKDIPAAARKRIDEELHKLKMLETGSPEYSVTRNYLDWATSVPWGVYSTDAFDLSHAREVLDAHHAGLDDVKQRIMEFLAVGTFKQEISGSIMLLAGPPRVGKTSIGRSVADALGRKFYRFSVGGMRDEAEIKGHRRTYIGALPGKLIQALKDVEVSNPVIMLDEIDKLGASYQGDPASALLEVLDPEQNKEFLDHYLDLRVDLSKVLFICTANQLDTIPAPLLDRMDTIRLSGYIAEEKLAIAKSHLWPRVLERHGLKKSQVKISDSTLKSIIEGYARESGVRNLEKLLQQIARKAVVKLLEDPKAKISVTNKDLSDYLGAPAFRAERILSGVGVVTGLAWTSMGGATLPIEAAVVHQQNRGFKLTGKLGDVMKESAEIAYSYTAGHAADFGGDPEFFNSRFLHLHVPEGATPKDGPSAGVTMTTALMSLMLNKRIKRHLAMTGELTLTGQVLPVGGIREKVIAARRSKIMEVILPEANRRDYEELPEHIRKGMTAHFAEKYADVFEVVFG